ncbi:adenylate kinase [Dehalococcoidia bacterium]|nr:adenylate kinase [Dehalococcoidia bacterium]MCL0078359.1 adenylate kinase [Dehalococcoidia bacterium]
MNVILLGAPGAGKGTQAEMISRELRLAHIASGDLFRQAQSSGTELGNMVSSYMERGLLVPDEVTVRMVLERIATLDRGQGFILDGFPRTLQQAEALEGALRDENKSIDRVLYIKVSNEELVRRLSGRWICRDCQAPYHAVNKPPEVSGKCDRCSGELYQRPDDAEETVRKRIEVYFSQTAPLIDYYAKKGKLLEAEGAQSVEMVSEEILSALKSEE